MRKAVFLDRDGTLVKTFPQEGLPNRGPRTVAEIEYLPGVIEACKIFRDAGFLPICVTNQPDVARGLVSYDSIAEVNDAIIDALDLRDLFFCIHDDKHLCACRKPEPGLIYTAAVCYDIQLSESWMFGDNEKTDRGAALNAKIRFGLITEGWTLERWAKWISRQSE